MVLSNIEVYATIIRDTLELLEDGPLHVEDSRLQDLLKKYAFNLEHAPEFYTVTHSHSCLMCPSGTCHTLHCKHGSDKDEGTEEGEGKSCSEEECDARMEGGEQKKNKRKDVLMETGSSNSLDDFLIKFKRIVFLCPKIKMVGPKFYLHKHLVQDWERNRATAPAKVTNLEFTTSNSKQKETNFNFKMSKVMNSMNIHEQMSGFTPAKELSNKKKDGVANKETQLNSGNINLMEEGRLGQSLHQDIYSEEKIGMPDSMHTCFSSHDGGKPVSSVGKYHLPACRTENVSSMCCQRCDVSEQAGNEQKFTEKYEELFTEVPMREEQSSSKQISSCIQPECENKEFVNVMKPEFGSVGSLYSSEGEAIRETFKESITSSASKETINIEVQQGQTLPTSEVINDMSKEEEGTGNITVESGVDLEMDEESGVRLESAGKTDKVNDKSMIFGGRKHEGSSVIGELRDAIDDNKKGYITVDEVDDVVEVEDDSSMFGDEMADAHNCDVDISKENCLEAVHDVNTRVDEHVRTLEATGFTPASKNVHAVMIDKVNVRTTSNSELEDTSKTIGIEGSSYFDKEETSLSELFKVIESTNEDVGFSSPDIGSCALVNKGKVFDLRKENEEPTLETNNKMVDVTRESLLAERSAVVTQEELLTVQSMEELPVANTVELVPDAFQEEEHPPLRTNQECFAVEMQEEHLHMKKGEWCTITETKEELSTVINKEEQFGTMRVKEELVEVEGEKQYSAMVKEEETTIVTGEHPFVESIEEQSGLGATEELLSLTTKVKLQVDVAKEELPAERVSEKMSSTGSQKELPHEDIQVHVPPAIINEKLAAYETEKLPFDGTKREQGSVMTRKEPQTILEEETLIVTREEQPERSREDFPVVTVAERSRTQVFTRDIYNLDTRFQQPVLIRSKKLDDLSLEASSVVNDDTVDPMDTLGDTTGESFIMCHDKRNQLYKCTSETENVASNDASLSTDVRQEWSNGNGNENEKDCVVERLKPSLKSQAQSTDTDVTNQLHFSHESLENEYFKDDRNLSCDESSVEMGWKDISGDGCSPQKMTQEREMNELSFIPKNVNDWIFSDLSTVLLHDHSLESIAEDCTEPENLSKEIFDPDGCYEHGTEEIDVNSKEEMVKDSHQIEPWASVDGFIMESSASTTYSGKESFHSCSADISSDISLSGIADLYKEIHDISTNDNNSTSVVKNGDDNITFDMEEHGNGDAQSNLYVEMCDNGSQVEQHNIKDWVNQGNPDQTSVDWEGMEDEEEILVPDGLCQTVASSSVLNEVKYEETPPVAVPTNIGPVDSPRNEILPNSNLRKALSDEGLGPSDNSPSAELEISNDNRQVELPDVELLEEKPSDGYFHNITSTGETSPSSVVSFTSPATVVLPATVSSKVILPDTTPNALDTDIRSFDNKFISAVPANDVLPCDMSASTHPLVEDVLNVNYPKGEHTHEISNDAAALAGTESFQDNKVLQGPSSVFEYLGTGTSVSVANYQMQMNAMDEGSTSDSVRDHSLSYLSGQESEFDVEMLQDIMKLDWSRENMVALRQVASEVMCIPEEDDVSEGEHTRMSTGEEEGESEGLRDEEGKGEERNSSCDFGSEKESSEKIEEESDFVSAEGTENSEPSMYIDVSDNDVEFWMNNDEKLRTDQKNDADNTINSKVVDNAQQDDPLGLDSDVTGEKIESLDQESCKSNKSDKALDVATNLALPVSPLNPITDVECGVNIAIISTINSEDFDENRNEIRSDLIDFPVSNWPQLDTIERGENVMDQQEFLRSCREDTDRETVISDVNDSECSISFRESVTENSSLAGDIKNEGFKENMHENILVTDEILNENLTSSGVDIKSGVTGDIANTKHDHSAETKTTGKEIDLNLKFDVDLDWVKKTRKNVNKYCQMIGRGDENMARNPCGLYVMHYINKVRGGPQSKIRYPLPHSQQDLNRDEKMNLGKTLGEVESLSASDHKESEEHCKELAEQCELQLSKHDQMEKEEDVAVSDDIQNNCNKLDYEVSQNTTGVISSTMTTSVPKTTTQGSVSEIQNGDVHRSNTPVPIVGNVNVDTSNEPCDPLVHENSLPLMAENANFSMNILYSLHLHEEALKNQKMKFVESLKKNEEKEEEIMALKSKIGELENELENILNENLSLVLDNKDLLDALTQCINAKDEAEENIKVLRKANQQLEMFTQELVKLVESQNEKGDIRNKEIQMKLRKAENILSINSVHFRCMMREYHKMRLKLRSAGGPQCEEFCGDYSCAPDYKNVESYDVSIQNYCEPCRESLKMDLTRDSGKEYIKCPIETSICKLAPVLSTSRYLDSVNLSPERFPKKIENLDEEIGLSRNSQDILLMEGREKKSLYNSASTENGEWKVDKGTRKNMHHSEEAGLIIQKDKCGQVNKNKWTRNTSDDSIQLSSVNKRKGNGKDELVNCSFVSDKDIGSEEMKKSVNHKSKLHLSQKKAIRHVLADAIDFNERLQARSQREVEAEKSGSSLEMKSVSLKERNIHEANTHNSQHFHKNIGEEGTELGATEDRWDQEQGTEEQKKEEKFEDSHFVNSLHMRNQRSPLRNSNPEIWNGGGVQAARKIGGADDESGSCLNTHEGNERMVKTIVSTSSPEMKTIPLEGSDDMQSSFATSECNGFRKDAQSKGYLGSLPFNVHSNSIERHSVMDQSFSMNDFAHGRSNYDGVHVLSGLNVQNQHLNFLERTEKVSTGSENEPSCDVTKPLGTVLQSFVEYEFPGESTGAISKLTPKVSKCKENSSPSMANETKCNGERLMQKWPMPNISQKLLGQQDWKSPGPDRLELEAPGRPFLPESNDLCTLISKRSRGVTDLLGYLQVVFPNIPKSELQELVHGVRKCHNDSLTGLSFNQVAEEIRQTQFEKSGMCQDICSVCQEPLQKLPMSQLQCSHTFHQQCLRAWLSLRMTCPICRCIALVLE